MNESEINIVVPAYNESDNIFDLVKSCKKYGRVIVIDDASSDTTAELASQAGAYVIKHLVNTNIKQAVVDGLRKSLEHNCKYIIQMDAGFSHNPDDIPNMIRPLKENYDMTIGSRLVRGGKFINHPANRIILTKIGSALYRFAGSMSYRDLTSGFRGYKYSLVDYLNRNNILDNLRARAIMNPELTYKISKKGFKIVEVPIQYRSSVSYNINKESILEANSIVLDIFLDNYLRKRRKTGENTNKKRA